jgi:hypothetical protein
MVTKKSTSTKRSPRPESPVEFRRGLRKVVAHRQRSASAEVRELVDEGIEILTRAYRRGGLAEAKRVAEAIERAAAEHSKI